MKDINGSNDIFISYNKDDRKRVAIIAELLKNKGYSVWWDIEIHVGENFRQVIEVKLKDAKCVIVIWSKKSVKSNWVIDEAGEVYQLEKLVPVLIDDVKIPMGFRQIQTVKLINWDGTLPNSEFEFLLASIVKIIGFGGNDIKPKPKPPNEELINSLKDGKTVQERGNSAFKLGELKDIYAIEPLIERLNDKKEDFQVRGRAAMALGEIGDKIALEPLMKALDNKENLGFVRAWAAWSFGKHEDKQEVSQRLISYLNTNLNSQSEDKLVVRLLIKLLDDEDEGVRLSAVEALGKFWDEDGVNALQKTAKDKDEDVSKESVESILKISKELIGCIEGYGVDISGASKEFRNAEDALENKKLDNVFQNANEARKIARRALEIAKPDILVTFPQVTCKIKASKKVPITISNKGSINAININIKWNFDKEQVKFNKNEINLKLIKPTESKSIDIFITPMIEGDLPITIECTYTNPLGNHYQNDFDLIIQVFASNDKTKQNDTDKL
ncbi:MAG: HEAT repeat domain-containing protein [Candidatus Methanoperedenaceae archaeon]|nr:HEAT repeat domain-containing protein [Candidatus Methanoperedenaceae archaeon]